MGVGRISRWGLEQAIDRFDEVGREAFLAESGFGRSTHYFVVRSGKRYDSKPLLAMAWRLENPSAPPIGPGDFSGGMDHAVARLVEAGAEMTYVDGRTSIAADNGSPIDASFGLEGWGDRWEVIIHSRGGTKGTRSARNTEYGPGLRILLHRLAGLNACLLDGAVDSASVIDRPLAERRLDLPYPLELDGGTDIEQIAAVLQQRQSQVAKTSDGAKGGNPTRRIRLWVQTPGVVAGEELRAGLRDPVAEELHEPGNEFVEWLDRLGGLGSDAPSHSQGMVKRIERDARLRDHVKSLYDYTCQRCGTRLETPLGPVAEAAHIHAVGERGIDRLSNLLCLCPNCHATFDRGGWWLDDEFRVHPDETGQGAPLTLVHPIDVGCVRHHRARACS